MNATPELGIEVGMAGEFVLGMHGELTYDGVRLAGLWPKEQMRLAAKAGATIFGPAVTVNTGRSCAWNVARALTIVKPCSEASAIPIHMNVGMGVGAVPMSNYAPVDAVSRASGPASTSCVSTACRSAAGTCSACPPHTPTPRGWAVCERLETWSPAWSSRGMRLTQAKEYVAGRLGVEPATLSDPIAMADVRAELGLGRIVTFEATYPDEPNAIEAKFNISALPDVPINCVDASWKRTVRAREASSGSSSWAVVQRRRQSSPAGRSCGATGVRRRARRLGPLDDRPHLPLHVFRLRRAAGQSPVGGHDLVEVTIDVLGQRQDLVRGQQLARPLERVLDERAAVIGLEGAAAQHGRLPGVVCVPSRAAPRHVVAAGTHRADVVEEAAAACEGRRPHASP